MKTISTTLLLLLAVFTQTQAQRKPPHVQPPWQWQNPLPQGNSLFNMQVVNSNTIVAVGQLNTFIKSTDAGNTWSVQHYIGGTANDLQSVWFTSEQIGYAIDYLPGNLYYTTDGGLNWNIIVLSAALNKIYFSNSTGYIIGDAGLLYRYDGNNWNQLPATGAEKLVDIKFTAVDTGFILGQRGTIYMSSDTGKTWATYINAPSPLVGEQYRAFWPFGSSDFRVVGKTALVYTTTDGGNNWDKASTIYFPEDLQSIYFIDKDTGIAAGGYRNEAYGDVFRTTDGGKSWESVFRTNFWSKSIGFTDKLHGFIVGLGGVIAKTTDGGITWTGNPDLNSGLWGVDLNANKGIIVGLPSDYGLSFALLSNDRGRTWTKGPDISVHQLFDVKFTNGDTAIAVGAWTTIYRTTDAGTNWTRISSGLEDTSTYFYSVTFPTRDTGYLTGTGGTVLKTVDAGLTWQPLATNTSYNFSNISFVDGSNGLATMDLFQAAFITHNGGKTWDSIEVGPLALGALNAATFIDKDTGIAIGYFYPYSYQSAFIARTTDGGATWDSVSINNPNELFAVQFSSKDTGIVVGALGTIYQTVDAGRSWQQVQSPVYLHDLHGVKTYSIDEGTIVGQDVILHHSAAVISYLPEILPGEHALLGNIYPNPVSDETHFTLALPVNAQVRLSICSITGAEVQPLVNEQLNAGVYTLQWQPAEQLPNGIYFLKLEMNGVTKETKKAIVIR